MPFRSLAADDIFISYTRLDASTYAAGLADELTKKGFSCFIDKLGTDPNKDLPDMLRRKVKSCAMLVVVGTERAATRKTIADEIAEFLKTGRGSSIVPIDFSGAVYGANWYPLVEGIAPEPEKNALALDDGEPSPSVLSRIEKQFNYTRRNQRLRRAAVSMAVVFALLLLAGIGAAVYARQQIILASAERARALGAREEADKARSDADALRVAADTAKNNADREARKAAEAKTKADAAEVRAGEAARREQAARELEAKATANARLQETIGSSRAKATAALGLGPAEPDHALMQSVEAYRVYPTVEARRSLLTNLELYPNLVGVARGNPNPIESLASCHNGAVLVSTDDTGLTLFWDAARKRVFKRVEPRAGIIYDVRVACAPSGSLCAADDVTGKLTVWEVQPRGEDYEVVERISYKSLTPLNIPVPITPVFVASDLLVTVADASMFRRTQDIALVDLSQAAPQPVVKTLTVPADVTREDFVIARTLTANPATRTIAIGFNHGIALWHLDALDKPATWLRHPKEWSGELTESLSFSPDGKYLAVSVHSEQVAVWNLSEDEPTIVNKKIYSNAGTFVALFNHSQEDTYLLTARTGGEMMLQNIWDTTIWNRSFKPDISALIATGDSGSVATGSSDGLLATWDMDRVSRFRQSLAQDKDAKTSKLGLQLLSDVSSDYIVLGDADGIRLEIKHSVDAPHALSPDRRMLAFGDSATPYWNISIVEPTSIVLWDVSDKAHPRRLNSLTFDGRPVTLSFAGDGATLAASYDNGRIVVWDYLKGTRRKQFLVPKARNSDPRGNYSVGQVALSADGRMLAAKSDGPISLWDVETGLLLGRLGPESYPFMIGKDLMVFSRDGKSLIVGYDYNGAAIDIWNLDPEAWATMASGITGAR